MFNRILSIIKTASSRGGLYVYLKKIRKHRYFDIIAAKVLSWLMRLSYYTTLWTIVGKSYPEEYHKNKKPFIVCLWHDRLMLAPCVWKWREPLHVLASNHGDGRLIAKVVKNFSMPAVFGSTGKGVAALRNLVRLAKNGKYIAIIPDGPRGPRHKLAPGLVVLSKLTKTDIIPYSFCVKRFYRFNSWDKLIFVWPFNRGVQFWGKPITYEQIMNLSQEDAVLYVESKINEASEKAYRILKNDSVENI